MSKLARVVFTLVLLAMFATSLVACGGTAAPTQAPAAKIKVGLSFSDFATERWKNEEVLMRKLLEDKGYEVISQEANHDVKAQNDQIDNMVSQGVKALVVVAEDGDAIVTSVDKAADAGVKVVAYDRLIKTSKIAAYLSFDNVEVGRQQALGVMKAAGADSWDVAGKGKMRVIQLAGSPTDNNATLFTKGQTEILQPYIDKGTIEIIAQQGVENWDPANALKLMENLLTAANNDVDAVVASNDGTALGALQAMKAQGLAGKTPISGQDATADGSNSIVKGELTVSILKDIRNLSPLAIDVVDKLLKGQAVDGMKNFTLAELTVDPSKKGEVPCVFLQVQQVNKDNVYKLVVESGFQSYDDVYRDIPADMRPAKPGESVAPAGGKIKVGLSFSDFATERWKNEEVLMRKLLEDKGYEVISQEANHDVKLQNDQIDNMVAQGVKALVVIAEDGDAAVTAVDKAADAGVKVVAYDRLIKTSKISAYLSFDNVEVGRQQALGVMKAAGADTWDVAGKGKMRVIQLAGSPTDNNATLFTKGQTEILQPYIDKGTIEIIAQQGVENWDPANALKLMENLLTAANNDVDAVVASNDGTALGALQAMKAQGLAGKTPISGQDATADGSNSIVKDELTVSILKDIRNLSPLAIDVVDKLLKGQPVDGMKNFTLAELTVDPSKKGEVPCVFLQVQQVNKDNVYQLVVESGFQSYDDVYRDIPADKRPAKPGEAVAPAGPKIKVGLSFSDFATERWKNEEVLMRKLLEAKGYEVISQEANHDVKLQNDQIDNMVAQGVKALIVIAEDGDAAVTAVDKAADAGVKVIAYDRLIKTSKISAYLSFDNVEVGRQQALGVMKAIGLPGSTTWTKDNPAKVIQLAGSPTDNNATLFTKGQTEILQPYIDSGVIKIIAQQGVENWDPANALKLMENLLTAANNKVDAVVASNDGTALGALQAMKAQGLAGIVPISGQDATADGSNSIVKGELTVSILKDIRNLSPLAIDVVDKLLKGQAVDGMKNFTLAELTVDPSKTGEVPCVFLQVQQVNKENVYDLVVKSGFQAYDDVYRDIPEGQRPAKP